MVRLVALAALGLSAPLHAAQNPAPDEIVVEGTRLTPQERQQKATSYVRTVSSNAFEGQFARWLVPLCVTVDGIDPKLAEMVAERVRQTAQDVGAKLAKGKCRPNVVVEFTGDALKRFNQLDAKLGKSAFKGMNPAERDKLRQTPEPVKWLYGTAVEGAEGNTFQSMPPAGITGPLDSTLNTNGRFGNSYNSSMIRAKSRASIGYALILVDANRMQGRTLASVANYVSFVALARTRAGISPNDPPTILGLFGAQGPIQPTELTEWDRAYLTALYRMPMDRMAAEQSKYLAGKMANGAN